MRKPEPGDMVICRYNADDLGAVVSRVWEEDEGKWGVHCSILTLSSVIDNKVGTLYETKDEALEVGNNPSHFAYWVKPDPYKKLLEDIADAILLFNQSQL